MTLQQTNLKFATREQQFIADELRSTNLSTGELPGVNILFLQVDSGRHLLVTTPGTCANDTVSLLQDEINHVKFLRFALGDAAVSPIPDLALSVSFVITMYTNFVFRAKTLGPRFPHSSIGRAGTGSSKETLRRLATNGFERQRDRPLARKATEAAQRLLFP